MKYLFVAPQLGFAGEGVLPGGLMQFCRCVARALASSPDIHKLGVWCQLENKAAVQPIMRMLAAYAHSRATIDVQTFNGSRAALASRLAQACVRKEYDRVMYGHIHQAQLSILPGHSKYDVWLVGVEVFHRLSMLKGRALRKAHRILSISKNTADVTAMHNPGVPRADVVHLCVEPPTYGRVPLSDDSVKSSYDPGSREPAVLIVGKLNRDHLYKGHQQLIMGWPGVVRHFPQAELWIAGHGDGATVLHQLADRLPLDARRQIRFLGEVDDETLDNCYRRARVFAMPSLQEGFGLVFVEAARYGLPCIGGLHDSVKEIVLHEQTGLLSEQHPHDLALACLRLLTDGSLAKRLGDAGRQRYLNNFRFPHFQARLLNTLGFRLPDPELSDAVPAHTQGAASLKTCESFTS